MLPRVENPDTAVFVDAMAPCIPSQRWHWKESCHMAAYNLKALHEMAERIGLKRQWFQNNPVTHPGKMPHYDLNQKRRAMAIAAGAIEITRHQMADLILYWKTK